MSERWSALVASVDPAPLVGQSASLGAAERAERLAFTVCKMGTIGLLAWLLTPALFVLLMAGLAVVLYGRALLLGVTRSRCFLRRPAIIMAFWLMVAGADVAWLVWRGGP